MQKILVGFLTFYLLIPTSFAQCPPLTKDELQKLQIQHDTIRLKFFASWCGSCRDDLMAPTKDAIMTFFVGTMDTQERVRQAITYARGNTQRCYWDQDSQIAESLGVKSVPFETVLERKPSTPHPSPETGVKPVLNQK